MNRFFPWRSIRTSSLMTTLLWVSFVVVSLTACDGFRSPRRTRIKKPDVYAAQNPNLSSSMGGGSIKVSADPFTALNQIDTVMKKQGYKSMGSAVRNPNMPQFGVMAYAIDAQTGFCYTAIALAKKKTDLNMIVLDPLGNTVGYHVQSDPYPWVTFCPPVSGRFIARLQMARGSSDYYYVIYKGPAATRASLISLLGESQVQTVDETPPLETDTETRISELEKKLKKKNYKRVGSPMGASIPTGQERDFPLNLKDGICYAFGTFGGTGTKDTNALILDAKGKEIQKDVEKEKDALVEYCPQDAGRYILRTQMAAGKGSVFVAGFIKAQEGKKAEVEEAAVAILNDSKTGERLEENFRLLDADMQARGYRTYGETARDYLGKGKIRDFDISLEGGKCYAILAVGDTNVKNLDLALKDPSGKQIDQDIEEDARPIVRVCPLKSGNFRMQVRMEEGKGNFVYSAYKWPRGINGPFGLKGLIYVRLAEVSSLLSVEGYEPDLQYMPEKGSLESEQDTAIHELELSTGQCYAVLVVGGEGMTDLDVSLIQGDNKLAEDQGNNAFPSVRYCTDSKGQFQINVSSEQGTGGYFYQVFKRVDKTAVQ